jgi:outer membrane lipoprotein-sorting protein
MMTHRSRIYRFTAVALLLFAGSLAAQGELTRISQAYQRAEHLSMSVNVKIYETQQDKQGTVFGSGTMYRSGGNYYSKFNSTETLINGDCSVMADHQRKEIICLPAADKAVRKPKPALFDVDSILAANDSVVRRGFSGAQLHYTIYSRSADIQRIEVYADTNDYFIRKLEYYYSPSNEENDYGVYKAVIVYSGISTAKPAATFFDEKKFVVRKNGTWLAAPAYKSYHLILQ